ncbi:maltokinase N-terminal cap-like domain-containing protein [Antrihabitans cavernicola]|uniref:Maltokinase n=1 Tax=Antrihabitans cavernicola TaxID=2495913 RepID=A0A5A7SAZ2_9NOCA|nr:phosphotransferase [Spelaeibacter cavernicola]KAA0021743.1 phosphotransferase [Spelaeibacter cavernicola]
MTLPVSPDDVLAQQLVQWLPSRRWYAAKNSAVDGVRILLRETLSADDALIVEHVVIAVDSAATDTQLYQVPLGYRPGLPDHLLAWALPEAPTPTLPAYDGLRDPDVIACYTKGFAGTASAGALQFDLTADYVVEPGLHARVLEAEQSNTSVVLGESLLLKVFRRIEPGINPDVELHRALGEVGCEFVAPLRGWIDAVVEGSQTTVAMLQDYAANSADGWSMALTSVRDLFAEADLHADELGTDFAGESERLGIAVAKVHADLARLPGASLRPMGSGAVAGMLERLDLAVAAIPELAAYRDGARALFEAATDAGPTPVQRIHGDLHLGQVLRTPERWLLIDFEGEPVKSIAERQQPDSPLRDVAGMLRSFDYAGHHALGDAGPSNTSQRMFRATEWTERNCSAFCDGYGSIAGFDPRDHAAVLLAYELDKAVYEAIYEARHRPQWLPLPMRAIARLAG